MQSAHADRSDQPGALFAGPGELPSLCRELDWAATPLGPSERWSSSLRTIVRVCLHSRFPMAIWAGPEFVLIYNDGFPPVLGPRKHPWALGRPGHEVWAEVWDSLGPQLLEALSNGASTFEQDHRAVLRREDVDEELYFTYSFSPIYEENGAAVGVLSVVRETTEHIRHVRDLLRMFELSHDLLAIAGTDDYYRKVNPAFTRVLGWTEAELLAHPGSFFVHPDDLARTDQELGQLAGGQPTLQFENRYRHRDGSYRWLSWTAAPVPDEGRIYAAARDITDRKRAEARERVAIASAAFRLRLADTLRPLTDSDEIQRQAARVLGEALEATRVHYAQISEDGEYGFIRAEYRSPGITSVIGRHRLDDFGPTVTNEFRAGRALVVEDVDNDPRLSERERAATTALDVRAYMVLPLVKRGLLVAVLVAHQSTPRSWTAAELGLMEDTAERTWEAVERARAEEALRESEERLRQILRHVSAGVFERHLESGEVYWSPENYELHGVDPQRSITSESWDQNIHPDDLERLHREVETTLAGPSDEFRFEFRVRHPTRGIRWLHCVGRVERDADGRPLRVRGLNLDVTDRRRAEDELREADRRKTEFLAVLSHELRNPLAPIRNSIHLLETAPPHSELAERAKRILVRQSDHLTRIVDDLLDVTRISRGKIQLDRRRLDLRELVRRTADDLRSAFEAKRVELRVELIAGPVWIDADATRIAQIVTNLLNNAVKFTPADGAVAVSVGVSVETGVAKLCVRDTGAGMQPEDLERMFEPFAQAEQSLARQLGGLGLGLALVKGLVELHGGTIEARSEGLGRGAEFVVTLPLALTDEQRPNQPPRASGADGRRILIIEDNVDACQTLADLLALLGYEVEIALDGQTGIELARKLAPDVVICDIGLPDRSGYEVARALRTDERLRATRLIALSGYAQAEDRARARAAGFDAHLAKPPPLEPLRTLLT